MKRERTGELLNGSDFFKSSIKKKCSEIDHLINEFQPILDRWNRLVLSCIKFRLFQQNHKNITDIFSSLELERDAICSKISNFHKSHPSGLRTISDYIKNSTKLNGTGKYMQVLQVMGAIIISKKFLIYGEIHLTTNLCSLALTHIETSEKNFKSFSERFTYMQRSIPYILKLKHEKASQYELKTVSVSIHNILHGTKGTKKNEGLNELIKNVKSQHREIVNIHKAAKLAKSAYQDYISLELSIRIKKLEKMIDTMCKQRNNLNMLYNEVDSLITPNSSEDSTEDPVFREPFKIII